MGGKFEGYPLDDVFSGKLGQEITAEEKPEPTYLRIGHLLQPFTNDQLRRARKGLGFAYATFSTFPSKHPEFFKKIKRAL